MEKKQGKQPRYKVILQHPKFRGFKVGDELHMVEGHPSGGQVLSHKDWTEGKPIVNLEDVDKYPQIFQKIEQEAKERERNDEDDDDVKSTRRRDRDDDDDVKTTRRRDD